MENGEPIALAFFFLSFLIDRVQVFFVRLISALDGRQRLRALKRLKAIVPMPLKHFVLFLCLLLLLFLEHCFELLLALQIVRMSAPTS